MQRRKFLGMIAAAPVVAAMPKLAIAKQYPAALSAADSLACFGSCVTYISPDFPSGIDISAALRDVLPLAGVPENWLK